MSEEKPGVDSEYQIPDELWEERIGKTSFALPKLYTDLRDEPLLVALNLAQVIASLPPDSTGKPTTPGISITKSSN